MRDRYVLVVAPADDVHALAVARRIDESGHADALVLDPATVPLASPVEWSSDRRGIRVELTVAPALPEGISRRAAAELLLETPERRVQIDATEVRAVWLRRPRAPLVHPRLTEPELRRFAGETSQGVFDALLDVLPVHNDPTAESRASRKLLQLELAQRCGWATPRTLVTTSPEAARAFVAALHDENRDVIYKPNVFSPPDGPPTRLFREDDWQRLGDVALCPTTFQERIAGGVDLRVLVVGGSVFAAEWRTADGPTAEPDVRIDDATMWPAVLEPSVERKLLALHAALGLSLGVYDLKVDAALGPVFLECNASGQWLDLETEAGYPASDAVACFLTRGEPGSGGAPFGIDDLAELIDAAFTVR